MATARENNTVYVSIAMSKAEKAALDEAVRRSGLARNRFLRNLIQSVTGKVHAN